MSYKLGITPASDLPWEFSARIRPWFQPLVYFLIARPLMVLGLKDMFAIAFVLRLATGCFRFWRWHGSPRPCCPPSKAKRNSVPLCAICLCSAFCPICSCAPSSENFLRGLLRAGPGGRAGRKIGAAAGAGGPVVRAGVREPLSDRLAGAGPFAWLAIDRACRGRRLSPRLSAAAWRRSPLACWPTAGAMASSYFRRWAILDVNLVQGVAAHQFGREPVFAYLYLLPAQIFFAITLVLMAGMVAMWLRNPRHAVTWVTLPFVLAHVAVAHKEARFLFPLAILATAFPVLGFSPRLPLWREYLRASLAMAPIMGGKNRYRHLRDGDGLFRALSLWREAAHAHGQISLSPRSGRRFTALPRRSSPIPCTGRSRSAANS